MRISDWSSDVCSSDLLALQDACRRCFASLFTDRAIAYREAKGFDHLDVALSIGIQQMVRSDLSGSGVMFSIDTETGFPDAIVISAARSEEHTSELQSLMRTSYAVFCMKQKKKK